ncbi:MmcQ/YjbR family DNA-binding protein [Mycobacterium sp. CPCC 205372]|uniref:MmcQ/YjbR family DNA-binding protein n=1 Tax=Mycobacterium hippophais TaxID=3016340 RepID=A0ABT4PSP4_9MYCO|nr:MmcQ/YjbR family DNA-binding protein [Mycobacterium hippophais]MCZ8379509.1 MmcQ/YjbR family DNA-binding protein [Mycobacterium hippophais]
MADWAEVARIAGGLPETSPRTWRVRKKLVVWERPLRKADVEALGDAAPDGEILGAHVADEGVKFALIADRPAVFFTTPHFDGYPSVLVRLAAIDTPELTELITEAWLAQAPRTLVKAFLAGG